MPSSKSQASNSILHGYLILKHLNPGGENDVFLALHQASQTHVAIKVINRDKILDNEAASFILQRYDFLQRTQDPNIIRCYDIFIKQDCICIIMEYAEAGDLYTALMKKTFSNETLKKLALQLAKALFCLHRNGFYHGHLQLSSVLLDKEDNVKLADFFSASKMNSKDSSHRINPHYAAPEAIGSSLYQGPEADCWALGVILHILCFGFRPFVRNEFDKLVANVCKGNLVLPIIKHEAQDLIDRLLEPFPSRRFTITDVLQHSWLKGEKNELTYKKAIDLTQEVEGKCKPEEGPIVCVEHELPLDAKPQVKEDTTSCRTYEMTYLQSCERIYIPTDVVSKEPHSCGVPLPVLKGYRFLAFLGKGSYGRVYLAIHLESNCAVAVKKMKRYLLENAANVSNMFLEYEILRRTEHPHIIRAYNMFTLIDHVYVIMEYASGGEFAKLVENNLLSKWEEKRIFRQLCTAVYCIHQQGYCHRDLKPNNIVLGEDGNAKLIDFGLVEKIGTTKYSLDDKVGTPFYVAPEVIVGSNYRGPEIDCWSLGVILYRLCYGELPFDGLRYADVFLSIMKCRPVVPNCQHPAHDLIMGLLDPNGETRYTINDIFDDMWIDEDFATPLRVEAMNLVQSAKILTKKPLFCEAHNLPINEVLKCSGQVGKKIPVWPYNETPSYTDEEERDFEAQKNRKPDNELNCDENSLSKSKKDEHSIRKDSGEYPNADSYNEMFNCSTDSSVPTTLSFSCTSNSPNGTLYNLDELGHSENKLGALEKSGGKYEDSADSDESNVLISLQPIDLTIKNERCGSSGDLSSRKDEYSRQNDSGKYPTAASNNNMLCSTDSSESATTVSLHFASYSPHGTVSNLDELRNSENKLAALEKSGDLTAKNERCGSSGDLSSRKDEYSRQNDSGKYPTATSNNKMLCSTVSSESATTVSFHSSSYSSHGTLSNLDEQGYSENKSAALEKSGDLTTLNESLGSSESNEFEFRDTESFWKEELPKKRIQFKPAENYVELLPSVSEEGKKPNYDNAATKNIVKEPALIFGAEVKEAKVKSTASDYEESRYHKEIGSCDSSFFHLDSD